MEPSHIAPLPRAPSTGAWCHTGQERIHRHHAGYLYTVVPEHPLADVNGRVLHHRWVMERHLGRYLLPTEIVHHLNGQKDDNRIENLHLYASPREHMQAHGKQYQPEIVAAVLRGAADPKANMGQMPVSKMLVRAICRRHGVKWIPASQTHLADEAVAAAAALHPKIKDAAKYLGVSGAHLYLSHSKHFQKRQPPGFLDAHRAEICTSAMTEPAQTIAERYRTSRATVLAALTRWSKAGDLPIALVERLNASGRRRKKLARTP